MFVVNALMDIIKLKIINAKSVVHLVSNVLKRGTAQNVQVLTF